MHAGGAPALSKTAVLKVAEIHARPPTSFLRCHSFCHVFSAFRSRSSCSSSSNSWSACAQRNNDRSRSGIVNSQCSGRISEPPLLVPQSNHGIDVHRAARRYIASSEGDKPEKQSNRQKCDWIKRANAVKQA